MAAINEFQRVECSCSDCSDGVTQSPRMVFLGLVVLACPVGAEALLPAPTGSGPDQVMADLAAGYQRQQELFAAAENGLSLDTFFFPEDVELVKSFFTGDAERDFHSPA
jgi:hypothetical protein